MGMAETSYILEGSAENFRELVLENSTKGPVLVYYWADWAGPCHRFLPVLAEVVNGYGGRLILVTVDTVAQPGLASEQGVKSVPLLRLVRNGRVVEELMGYQPEPELRRILDGYVAREGDDRPLIEALRVYRAGDFERGLALLAQAALDAPEDLRIPVALGKLLLARGRLGEAEAVLGGLPEEVRERPEVSALIAHTRLIRAAQEAPERGSLEARLREGPEDPLVRYRLAALRLVEDDLAGALDELLVLVQRHPDFQDGAGRQGMLAIFHLLGEGHELVERYRPRLFNALH